MKRMIEDEVTINAIKELSPKLIFEDLKSYDLNAIESTIKNYSEDAYYICIGKELDFKLGVLLTLQLHKIGVLPNFKRNEK